MSGEGARPPAPDATPRGVAAGRYRRVPDQAVGQGCPGRAGLLSWLGRSSRPFPGVDRQAPLAGAGGPSWDRRRPRVPAPPSARDSRLALVPPGAKAPAAPRQGACAPRLGARARTAASRSPVPGPGPRGAPRASGTGKGTPRGRTLPGAHRQPADRGEVVHVPLERGHEALLGLRQQDVDHAPAQVARLARGFEPWSSPRAGRKYSPRESATLGEGETRRAAASSLSRRRCWGGR